LHVGIGVGDDFQQRAVQAEYLLGGVSKGLDFFFLLGRRVGRRAAPG
jgi:hypothetical protein